MKKKLLGYYDYTVILTYCGMLFAFNGILHAINLKFSEAVFSLMMAGICDMFDGSVAATRMRNAQEKRFGIQIDSLSDLVSFGVFPAVFTYMISEKNALVGLAASLFALCALIRLAYFNVLEEERQRQTAHRRNSYTGVPVTTIAVLLPVVYLLYDFRVFRAKVCFPVLLIVVGIGFLLPFEVKKPNCLGKTGLLLLGVIEAMGLLFFAGWDLI